MPNNMSNNLNQVDNAIKTAIGIQNQGNIDRINQQASSDAALAEARGQYIPSDNSGQFKRTIFTLQEKVAALEASIVEKDALLLEWMHMNEAFKRLAGKYATKSSIPQSQLRVDLDEQILNTAEEDPQFVNTKVTQRAKDRASGGAS